MTLRGEKRKIRACSYTAGEWPLPFERCGKWSYVFKYKLGEVWFHQLNEGESLKESSNLVKLTSGDWAVLKLLIALAI